MVDKVQPVAFGFFADDGNVIYVETAHQQFRSGIHAGYVVLHICQEDIAVDVGDNHIKRTFAFQRGGIALGYGNIVHSIQFYIFEGVAHTPFIYVDSCTRGGSTHACQYGKDGSPTTHIEQCFALQVTIQQFAYDEACCLVVPCAECHLRIDDDVIFCLWDIVVKVL